MAAAVRAYAGRATHVNPKPRSGVRPPRHDGLGLTGTADLWWMTSANPFLSVAMPRAGRLSAPGGTGKRTNRCVSNGIRLGHSRLDAPAR
jgi:hypothetical protein